MTCSSTRSCSDAGAAFLDTAFKSGKLPDIREALHRLDSGRDHIVHPRELQKIQRDVAAIINAQLLKNLKAEDDSAMSKLLTELDHWTTGFQVTAYITKQLTPQRGDIVRDLTSAMLKSNEKLKEAMQTCNQMRQARAESRTRLAEQSASGGDSSRGIRKKSSGVDVAVGDRVTVTSGSPENPLRGVVRFIGTTSFAEGNWVGIELDEPRGKNNGEVQGKRYFECQPQHGYFIKPKNVVKDSTPH